MSLPVFSAGLSFSFFLAAVFNIHLASGAVDPESPYVEALRSAEILQVLSACEDAGQRGEVPIVVGDLNAGKERPTCAVEMSVFLEDCFLHVYIYMCTYILYLCIIHPM